MNSITAVISALVIFFAVSLLLTAGIAFVYEDWQALETFLLLAVSLGFLASLSILSTFKKFRKISRINIFFTSIIMWLCLAILASLPFFTIEKLTPTHAIFEAVSAVVTLGVSFVPRADISLTMVFYRSILAWQGGLLTLLLCIYVLGRYQVGGTPNQNLRLVLHSSKNGNPRILRTFFEVFIPYFALTMVCAAALSLAGIKPNDAVNTALNILSTNGFMAVETGATILNNIAGEIILMVFMLIGATNILWHRAVFTKKWKNSVEHTEASTFLLTVLLMSLIAISSTAIFSSSDLGFFRVALNTSFDVVSLMSTTGITHDYRIGIGLPIELVFALAVVGGCAYSTSGGLKVFRMSAMFAHSKNEIKKLVYPHLVIAKSVDENKDELGLTKAIWSALFISVMSIMTFTLVLSLLGVNLVSALGASVGAFSSTANLLVSSLNLPVGEMPSDAIMISLSILSLIARIELLVVLAIFSRVKWK